MKNNETKEIWVPAKYIRTDGTVLDFTSKYEVSSLGRVRSLNYNHTGKTKVMSYHANKAKDGSIYYQVWLCKDSKQYCLKVHRLVLSSFDQEGRSPNDVVDHIVPRTSTSCNNCLNNLHWTTQKENSNTEHRKTLNFEKQCNRPDLSKRVKVTFSDGTHRVFPSAREAGRTLGINPDVPSHCINQHNGYYKKLNLHFEYVK